MVAILVDTAIKAEIEIDTLIIGGGAAGLGLCAGRGVGPLDRTPQPV